MERPSDIRVAAEAERSTETLTPTAIEAASSNEAAPSKEAATASEVAAEPSAAAKPSAAANATAEAGSSAEAKVRRRFEDAVAAFDRGACVEEATGELTPDLYTELPDGPVRDAVRSAFRCLAADPPRRDRETAVREAQAALAALPAHR